MTLDAALDLMSSLVLEDGRRWGQAAVSFQWEDAKNVLDPDSPTPYFFLTRSRGASKTSDLAAVDLAAMACQLPPRSRCYALAADKDQGRLLLDGLEGFIRRTPGLGSLFEIGVWRVTHCPSGSTLDVLAADAPGSWGLRPAFVVVDEMAQWGTTSAPRRLWESVSSAVAKTKGSRLVVLTTAGDPAHWSKKILDHAKADRLWRVHEVPGPAPWLDSERLEEQRRRLPESSYRRLFLNEWTAAEDRLGLREDIVACVTLAGPLDPSPGYRYVIGVDVGLKRDRTVSAIAHSEAVPSDNEDTANRIVLDRMEVWSGTRQHPVRLGDVEEWILQAARTFRAKVILDPWQAVGLAQRLRSRGILVEEFAFTSVSVGRLAVTMLRLLRDHALALPDDPDLLDELANVRLRETSPGVLRIDHDADAHDDRVIALALAAQHLLDRSPHRADPSVGLGVGELAREMTRANGFRMDQAGVGDVGWLR